MAQTNWIYYCSFLLSCNCCQCSIFLCLEFAIYEEILFCKLDSAWGSPRNYVYFLWLSFSSPENGSNIPMTILLASEMSHGNLPFRQIILMDLKSRHLPLVGKGRKKIAFLNIPTANSVATQWHLLAAATQQGALSQ